MRAFWWFKDNSIAGMARPGFNHLRWFDLEFDEAVVMGWLGQHSSGEVSLELFHKHLKSYVPKILRFYKMNEELFSKSAGDFRSPEKFADIMNRLAQKTQFIDHINTNLNAVNFKIKESRISFEIDFLKKQGISRLISLTERHLDKNYLQDHFNLHHIGIEDLGAPNIEQAHKLAEIIKLAKENREKIAVHCLAGIGRTSTMLMAAHILAGEKLEELITHIQQRNPSYVLTQEQNEFLKNLAKNY